MNQVARGRVLLDERQIQFEWHTLFDYRCF